MHYETSQSWELNEPVEHLCPPRAFEPLDVEFFSFFQCGITPLESQALVSRPGEPMASSVPPGRHELHNRG